MTKKHPVEKTVSWQKKWIVALLLFLLTVVSLMTGTRAWTSTGQSALNMGHNTVDKKAVYLQKYERDIEGKETTKAIAGATFYLYQVEKKATNQIGGVYTTDKEGKIALEVAPGDYYFEEIDPSSGYTFDKDKDGEAIKKYAFTVTLTSTSEVPIVTAYNQRQIGNLELSKTVVNADGSQLTTEQKQKYFDFTVTFSDNGTHDYQVDGGEKHPLKSGETLQLKHGQKAIFEKLPIGIEYIVTEIPVVDYDVSADASSGTIIETVSTVAFVNTYDPKVGNLEVAKQIVNADGSNVTADQKKKAFEFLVTFSDAETSYAFRTTTGRTGSIKSGDTFTLVHDEVLTFLHVPIGLAYTIQEKETPDYTSSPSVYSGTIRSKETVRLPFINQYQLKAGEKGSLLFDKQIVADQVDTQQEFSFILTFSDNGTYDYQVNNEAKKSHKSGESIKIKHGDQVHFAGLPAGIGYRLVEEPLKGYQPELQDIQGIILSNQEAHVSFHNYQEEKAALVVEKIGVGEGFDVKKEFTFHVSINGTELPTLVTLKAGETSLPMDLKLGDRWQVVEENVSDEGYDQTLLVHGTGVVTKPNEVISVTQTNTYKEKPMMDLSGQKTWSVPEDGTIPLPEKITVQLKNKETVVEVKEVTGPEWKYQFHVPKYAEDGSEIPYTIEEQTVENFKPIYQPGSLDIKNVYVAPLFSRALPIEKRITGDQPLEEESFEFRLSPSQQVVTIKGAGTGTFEPVIFTKAGTYVYTISEKDKGTLGYTYDASVYTWTVVVTENEGILSIQSEEIKKNEVPYAEEVLVFTNQFDPSKVIHEKRTISGEKSWSFGTQAVEEQPQSITVLLRANEEVVYQREVSIADEWRYSFVVNVYDEEGKEIHYSIDEIPVPGYKKTVTGYNLTNTYTPETPVPENENDQTSGSDMPKTGEKRSSLFMISGAFILISALVILVLRWKISKRHS